MRSVMYTEDMQDMEIVVKHDVRGVKITARSSEFEGSIEFPPELPLHMVVEILIGSGEMLAKKIMNRQSRFVIEWNRLADRFGSAETRSAGELIREAIRLLEQADNDVSYQGAEPHISVFAAVRLLMALSPTGSWRIAECIEAK